MLLTLPPDEEDVDPVAPSPIWAGVKDKSRAKFKFKKMTRNNELFDG